MISAAVKTHKNVTAPPQKAGATFFRKAGESSFFNARKPPAFFGHPVQPKLTVSSPGDAHEKEADTVADKVMRMQEPSLASPLPLKEEKIDRREEEEIQAKPEAGVLNKICCKKDNEEPLQAKADQPICKKDEEQVDLKANVTTATAGGNMVRRQDTSLYPSDVIQLSGRGPPQASIPFRQNLYASKGGGSKLPGETRMFMESRFNADFDRVRVHTGAGAEQMSAQVQAQAFTHGSDIYFNQGKYSPDSADGRLLLAHELTHTIQQGASPVNNPVSRKLFQKAGLKAGATPYGKAAAQSFNGLQLNTVSRAPQPPAQAPAANIDLSNKSGGSALPDEAKKYFEKSFKTDVSDIRIHTDEEAANICRSRRVAAFTQGKHICFDPSRYSPKSEESGALLAKQVSASLAQRSINVPGLAAKIDGAAKAPKPPPAPAKPKPVAKDAGAKDKKKTIAKGKEKTGKKKGSDGRQKGKGKGDRSEGQAFKAVKPNPKKSPRRPEEDPAFLKVVNKTQATARKQKDHLPAETKATDAQKAAPAAPKEAESKAKDKKADGMDEAAKEDRPFDAKSFKAELLKKIEEATPKTLEDVDEFKENNKVGEVKNVMGDKVSGAKQETTGPVAGATAQPLQVNEADNQHPVPLPPTPKGPKPAGVGAQDAAPKPKLDNEVSLQEQSQSLDAEMKANNVTEGQLEKSNEPSFTAALDEKKAAQKDAVERPRQYRKDEKLLLTQAKASATEQSAHALAGMDVARGKNLSMVVQHQQTTKTKDHLTRSDVAREIESRYMVAEAVVKRVLDDADRESNRIFDEGSEAARREFEEYVDRKMAAYKADRYSGFWGWLSWLEDKIFGMPGEVNAFYTEGRQRYLDAMDRVITNVANYVTAKLNEAKQAIRDGKKQIDDYVASLPKNLAEVGREAAAEIQDKFDSLEQSVNDKKNDLIEGLAKKYVDNLKKVDDRITEMKEANAGLIDKAIGFLKKVWKVIKDLYNLFTTILARLASIIGVILDNPSGFFKNVGKAFRQGFDNFKAKFLDYLEKGLMDWLATNLGLSGIELPDKFTPMALFTLVLQVLGLTKEHIREKARDILGERKVKLLETAGGILYRVANEGLGAIWEMIREKLTDLKDVVWEAIKSFIKTKIIEAAITFLLSLLNPIGAFVKVCMAIYDFLMMLVRFKDRIIELLDTILNAVTDIASGAVDAAANAIEKAFAKSIPVIIGFLAALLHLNDIAAKVRDIITRIRTRVDKALEFVIRKADGWIGKYAEGALRLQDKGAAMVEKGKKVVVGAGKKVAGAVVETFRGWLKIRKEFKTRDGQSHSIYFKGVDAGAELMVASQEQNLRNFLAQKLTIVEALNNGNEKKAKRTAITSATKAYDKAIGLRVPIDKLDTKSDKSQAEKEKLKGLIQQQLDLFEVLGDNLAILGINEIPGQTITTKITPNSGNGRTEEITADPLTPIPGNTRGSAPIRGMSGPMIPGWDHLIAVNTEPGNPKKGIVFNDWLRMHLIHENMHGPAQPFNLVATNTRPNTAAYNAVERNILEKLRNQNTLLWYQASVKYRSNEPNKNYLHNFPHTININWAEYQLEGDTNKLTKGSVHATGPYTVDEPPPLLGTNVVHDPKIYLRNLDSRRIIRYYSEYGVSNDMARRITSAALSGNGANLQEKIKDYYPKKQNDRYIAGDISVIKSLAGVTVVTETGITQITDIT